MSNVQARIEQVICVKYNLPGDIPHTARFLEDLGIDKGGEGYVDWQEFLMALEEEFGELKRLKTSMPSTDRYAQL